MPFSCYQSWRKVLGNVGTRPYRSKRALSAALLCCLGASSCGARTALLLDEPQVVIDPSSSAGASSQPRTCGAAPQCVARNASDPCGPTRLVDPTCDSQTLEWQCPSGAWQYQRVTPAADCLPLSADARVDSLAGSLSRVPTDDGRCLWIVEELRLSSGDLLRNVALVAEQEPTFAACPRAMQFLGGSPQPIVVFSDGSVDTTLRVQVTGGFLQGGQARVSYRLFRVDPNAVFGVTELGTGLGFWDVTKQRIVVFGAEQLRFGTDSSFGNASISLGPYAYLWGCNAPGHFLTEGCLLGRLDTHDGLELYLGADLWSGNAAASSGAIVFDDGPWISSVLLDPTQASGLLHVFAGGFSNELQIQQAQRPEGPWGAASTLARCTLSQTDPKAYCAGPIVHEELFDPTQPNELVVSYGVATTDPTHMGSLTDYWSRLTWLRR